MFTFYLTLYEKHLMYFFNTFFEEWNWIVDAPLCSLCNNGFAIDKCEKNLKVPNKHFLHFFVWIFF